MEGRWEARSRARAGKLRALSDSAARDSITSAVCAPWGEWEDSVEVVTHYGLVVHTMWDDCIGLCPTGPPAIQSRPPCAHPGMSERIPLRSSLHAMTKWVH
jgi:hypothetical protein